MLRLRVNLDGEQSLVDDVAQAIHHPRAIEVDPGGRRHAGASRSSALAETLPRHLSRVCRRSASNSGWPGVTHSRVFVLGRLAVRRTAGIPGSRVPAAASRRPVRTSKRRWGAPRIECVGQRWDRLQGELGTDPAASVMNRAIVSGTTRRSCARARRSISISRFSFFDASPSRAFWQMARNCPSSTFRSSRSSRSASP